MFKMFSFWHSFPIIQTLLNHTSYQVATEAFANIICSQLFFAFSNQSWFSDSTANTMCSTLQSPKMLLIGGYCTASVLAAQAKCRSNRLHQHFPAAAHSLDPYHSQTHKKTHPSLTNFWAHATYDLPVSRSPRSPTGCPFSGVRNTLTAPNEGLSDWVTWLRKDS